MITPSLALALCMLAAPALAAPPAACDPAKRPESREALLAAMTDEAKRDRALSQVGISKLPDGQWSSMNGGVVSALPLPQPLNQAYNLYCAALDRAVSETARAERVAANQAAIRAAPRAPEPTPAATSAKVRPNLTSRLKKSIEDLSGSLGTTTTEESPPTGAAVNCDQVRAQVETCDSGSMGDGNLGSDFKCRKARADAKALCR